MANAFHGYRVPLTEGHLPKKRRKNQPQPSLPNGGSRIMPAPVKRDKDIQGRG